MNRAESPVPLVHTGHVRNGVVVLDAPDALVEGQAVRVEPLNESENTERTGRIRQLQQLFDAWTEEDQRLSDEDADRLQLALDGSRGLQFRLPQERASD